MRALLRDVLCGYLDSDLKSLADDILLETTPEHLEIAARDLRAEPEPDTDEFEPVGEAELEPAPKAESATTRARRGIATTRARGRDPVR